MAIGDITTSGARSQFTIELLASATATNSVPSGASAGLAMETLYTQAGGIPSTLTLIVRSTAGSGTMTATVRLWGYQASSGVWFPLGTGTGSDKGKINVAAALDETSADLIRHAEPIYTPEHFTRLYLEITAIGGTSTAITGELIARAVA